MRNYLIVKQVLLGWKPNPVQIKHTFLQMKPIVYDTFRICNNFSNHPVFIYYPIYYIHFACGEFNFQVGLDIL